MVSLKTVFKNPSAPEEVKILRSKQKRRKMVPMVTCNP